MLFSSTKLPPPLVNLLIHSVSPLRCALVSEVGGISEESAACDWWSLGAILFELLTGTVSQKAPKHVVFVSKVLSDVYRCLGFQLAHTLFVVVPGCVRCCASVCVRVRGGGVRCLCV